MRLFNIIKQEKKCIFDLDGNLYHPRLRDEIQVGMVVGLEIAHRDLKRNETSEFLKEFAEHDIILQKYKIYLAKKQEKINHLKEQVRPIKIELETKLNDLKNKQSLLEEKLTSLRIKIKEELNYNTKIKLIKKIKTTVFQANGLKKKIKKLSRHENLLKEEIESRYKIEYKSFLINEYHFSKELFASVEMELDEDDLKILREIRYFNPRNKGWKETIFLKIVQKTRKKLYGDVINRFRKKDAKLLLKEGDRISFYPSNILFVPSLLNSESKLKSYYITKNIHEYYNTNIVTDWNGIFMDKSARDLLTPGSIARIQVRIRDFIDTWYVEILEVGEEILYGELLAYYKYIEEFDYDSPLKVGCILGFKKQSIIEIPISWNPHIKNLLEESKNLDNYGFIFTGMQCGEEYYAL